MGEPCLQVGRRPPRKTPILDPQLHTAQFGQVIVMQATFLDFLRIYDCSSGDHIPLIRFLSCLPLPLFSLT